MVAVRRERRQALTLVVTEQYDRDLQQGIGGGIDPARFDVHDHGEKAAEAAGDAHGYRN